MNNTISFKLLKKEDIKDMLVLISQMHPELTSNEIESLQTEMFTHSNYRCFGLFYDQQLIGISSCWISVRFYSGKQLEVVNVIIDNNLQSKGYGKLFFNYIEEWANQHECKSVELNTYVHNSRSHKFYFNSGYSIYGYHFVKPL